jgi:hypothetical protein
MLDRALRYLTLDAVVEGCRSESGQSRSEESGYCFELFRRALEDQEPAAWMAIDHQYKNLILHWMYNCSPDLPREELDEIVPEALPKFWKILTQSTIPLAERFAHVGAILKYLKQCAISVLRDHERRLERWERVQTRLESTTYLTSPIENEQELLTRVDQEKLLQLVRKWVETYVTDSQERLVLSLSFESGLSPAQIFEHYPQEFPDVQAVRRIKERLLKRARRALAHHHYVNGKLGQGQRQPAPLPQDLR